MKKPILLSAILLTTLVITSCKQQKKENSNKTSLEVVEKPKITIEKLEGSPAYEDAVLELGEPKSMRLAEGGELDFVFKVSNYELSAQTEGPNAQRLANSGKGQHIHFILNNQPYSAHYEPNFKKGIPDGVHHLVAFLSRSYHESVKNDRSVVVKKLEIGSNAIDSLDLDMEAPTLIYSRPKGTYSGKGTENILLDFFVLNTQLSEGGNQVKATINGEEFMISEWVPHIIKGLPIGEVTIALELIDAEGNSIPGPFNKVSRSIMLTE